MNFKFYLYMYVCELIHFNTIKKSLIISYVKNGEDIEDKKTLWVKNMDDWDQWNKWWERLEREIKSHKRKKERIVIIYDRKRISVNKCNRKQSYVSLHNYYALPNQD